MPWWWVYTETVSPRPPRLHRISTLMRLELGEAGVSIFHNQVATEAEQSKGMRSQPIQLR